MRQNAAAAGAWAFPHRCVQHTLKQVPVIPFGVPPGACPWRCKRGPTTHGIRNRQDGPTCICRSLRQKTDPGSEGAGSPSISTGSHPAVNHVVGPTKRKRGGGAPSWYRRDLDVSQQQKRWEGVAHCGGECPAHRPCVAERCRSPCAVRFVLPGTVSAQEETYRKRRHRSPHTQLDHWFMAQDPPPCPRMPISAAHWGNLHILGRAQHTPRNVWDLGGPARCLVC